MNDLQIKSEWTKPVAGQITYVLHQLDDGSWQILCMKNGMPKDTESMKAVLQSAMDNLGD